MTYYIAPGSGGSGTPGGSDTQLQFNDGGAFGGDSGLVFNKTTNKLTTGGDVELNDGGSFTTTVQTVTPTANRTISYPDATGTLALVGGSSTQVVYNNGGALAGISTLTYDGTTLTTAGRFVNSYTSIASTPAKAFTGTWFTGGSATTTKPHLLIEPSGTTSTAWSTSGTGLGVNAASGFAGNLIDLQVNGVRRVAASDTAISLNPSAAGGATIGMGFGGSNWMLFDYNIQALQVNQTLELVNRNIKLSTSTGTKIGTATTEKLAFYNATPVVQPAAVANATDAASVITQLNLLLSRLRDLGLIAT